MEMYDLPGIEGVDTRKLTRLLREKGTMNGMITSDETWQLGELLPRLAAYRCGKVVEKVSCREKYELPGARSLADNGPLSGSAVYDGERCDKTDGQGCAPHERKPSLVRELTGVRGGRPLRIALLDLGMKRNIAQCLTSRGCDVTVYPAHAAAREILADEPDGIMLSNGPGDPKECGEIIREVRGLYESGKPVFAICLGHQLMALAVGAKTYRLKYGHRGGNQPVKELESGRVYISSQNHGYAVDAKSMDPEIAAELFRNVNDGSNEGFRYLRKRILSVQFHPEACPGPGDSAFLFDRFMDMMEAGHER